MSTMQTKILHLFTRTPLHVGAGSSVGAIDQPVIRERHTGFPIIPGSALKGVLAGAFDEYEEITAQTGKTIKVRKGSAKELFGSDYPEDLRAGSLGFGEARLLAFPLRSAKGSYALATCPLALARYARDAQLDAANFAIPTVTDGQCFAGKEVVLKRKQDNRDIQEVALEEYVFPVASDAGEFPSGWAKHLSALLDDTVLREARTRFVLLSDGDFSHFALNACQISQHVSIDHETGTAKEGALFNTETVPSETLFYAPIHVLRADAKDNPLFTHFAEKERLLQFGGDATTGLGFCTVKLANA
jgi:CRISPR-associated protein Cmr4